MTDTFSTYHPIVNFIYFVFVLAFSMISLHPVILGISFVCAFIYSVCLSGKKALRFNIIYMLPIILFTAILNPAFNHEGVTILTYLPGGNPLTLESVIYGIAAAVMMATVICWFSCYNVVMTSDKFVYLFGKILPAISLLITMILRFVPKFRAQIKVVSDAQKCIGRDVSNGTLIQKIKHGIKILSIMITWSLENAIETADSMRSRGYGLPGRTAFSIYKIDKRDITAACIIAALGIYVFVGYFAGGVYWRYYPMVSGETASAFSVSIYGAWLTLCIMPVLIDIKEDRKWRALRSKI